MSTKSSQKYCSWKLLIIGTVLVLLYALHSTDMLGQAMKMKALNTMFKSPKPSGVVENKEIKTINSTTGKLLPQHPNLNQICYHYQNLSATNICCGSKIYTMQHLHKCGSKESARIRQDLNMSKRSAKKRIPHWVFVGNSRIRILFNNINHIFSGPAAIKYDKHYSKPVTVSNETVPFKISFIFDPYLEELPSVVERWLKNPRERPTRIHIGDGVNFMKDSRKLYWDSGQEAAGRRFQENVASVVPALQELTKYIPISWWTIERVVQSLIGTGLKEIWSDSNFEYYNDFLRKQLHGTDIAMMDSHIPLGELFIESCTVNYKPRENSTRCGGVVHQANMAVMQYAQMFLNHACNAYLDNEPNQNYCL